MTDNRILFDSHKPFDNHSSYPILGCLTCKRLIDLVCINMSPKENCWFRGCVKEIEHYDGHMILERFLRLYLVLYNCNNSLGVKAIT